jgi:hypothetical protein
MSYVERIIIGAILLISAYSLYNGSEERHQFHQAINLRTHSSYLVAKTIGRCLGCYRCIELYRQAVVIFIFTAGVSLLLDSGIAIAILAQIILIAINLINLRGSFEIVELQTVLISFALLVFLIRNLTDFRSSTKENSKVSNSKVSQPAKLEVANV